MAREKGKKKRKLIPRCVEKILVAWKRRAIHSSYGMIGKRISFIKKKNLFIPMKKEFSPNDIIPLLKRDKCDKRFTGCSEYLRKDYFRIDSGKFFPHPSTVRPPPVLLQSLLSLSKEYENAKDKNLIYRDLLLEQCKSIRQDCVLQRVGWKQAAEASHEDHSGAPLYEEIDNLSNKENRKRKDKARKAEKEKKGKEKAAKEIGGEKEGEGRREEGKEEEKEDKEALLLLSVFLCNLDACLVAGDFPQSCVCLSSAAELCERSLKFAREGIEFWNFLYYEILMLRIFLMTLRGDFYEDTLRTIALLRSQSDILMQKMETQGEEHEKIKLLLGKRQKMNEFLMHDQMHQILRQYCQQGTKLMPERFHYIIKNVFERSRVDVSVLFDDWVQFAVRMFMKTLVSKTVANVLSVVMQVPYPRLLDFLMLKQSENATDVHQELQQSLWEAVVEFANSRRKRVAIKFWNGAANKFDELSIDEIIFDDIFYFTRGEKSGKKSRKVITNSDLLSSSSTTATTIIFSAESVFVPYILNKKEEIKPEEKTGQNNLISSSFIKATKKNNKRNIPTISLEELIRKK